MLVLENKQIHLTNASKGIIAKALELAVTEGDLSPSVINLALAMSAGPQGHSLVSESAFFIPAVGEGYADLKAMAVERVANKLGMNCLTVGHAHNAPLLIYKGEIVGTFSSGFCNSYGYITVTAFESYMPSIIAVLDVISSRESMKLINKLSWCAATKGVATTEASFREPAPHPNILVNYPFLDLTPQQMLREFEAAKEAVLFFIGPPGTGKSTYVRYMLEERGWPAPPARSSVYNAVKQNLFDAPEFIDYLENLPSGSMVIVEDSDVLTEKRTNGNDKMAAILDIVDGLAVNNLKLIFSTNLESISSVDSALIREGRTFDILKFRHLTLEEANAARQAVNLDVIPADAGLTNLSLAKALNYGQGRLATRTTDFGFK